MRDLSVLKEALLTEAVGLVLDRFTETDGLVVVEAHSSVGELACPDCAEVSRRVHSRYQRHLAAGWKLSAIARRWCGPAARRWP